MSNHVYLVHERERTADGGFADERVLGTTRNADSTWSDCGKRNAFGHVQQRSVEYTHIERHPGTDIPPKDQWVLGRYGDDSCIIFHDGSSWTDDGNDLDAPDEWIELSDLWGKP